MKALFLCLFACTRLSCFAQTDSSLDHYLAEHKFTIRVVDSSVSLVNTEIPALLTKRMQGRQLFVYGEGFNHRLYLNNSIETALLEYFASRGLKYRFSESARSWIVGGNLFYKNPAVSASDFFPTLPPFYQRTYERNREIFRNGTYQYMALDFERPFFFNYTLHLLAARLDKAQYDAFLKLTPYFKDTSYLQLSPNNFVRFYKEQQGNFYRDSLLFHAALGDFYEDFRYLLSDPAPSTYNSDRNALMASHLLAQIHPAAAGDLYFMSVGMAHSRPGKKDGWAKTTVRLLAESDVLRDKIVVMNLYCERCHAEDGGDNWAFPFMKGAVLKSFQSAATDEIVLFDLSELGGEYEYIRKDYGDMLVFAKNQY